MNFLRKLTRTVRGALLQRGPRLALLACLATVLVHGPAYSAVVYKLTDLGTLGGNSSYGTAINDNGTAVGRADIIGGSPFEAHAFRWTPGGGLDDISGGLGHSLALDVNNAENVVGQANLQAFRWTPDNGIVFIDPGNNGVASDLNEASEAVGCRFDTCTSGGGRTIRWNASDTPTLLFPLFGSQGVAINDSNQFVATIGGGGGYYSDGSTLTLLTSIIPTDLNNSRQIVGSVGSSPALLDFDSNTTTLLGKLAPSDTISRAFGINEVGTIVGVSQPTGAFIYDSENGLRSLTSMLAPEFAGWTVFDAQDINNKGQIVGQGRLNDVYHAIILTPVPEPTALALATVALASFAVTAGYRSERKCE
jgi:probable HAF family extracellular repeat protein